MKNKIINDDVIVGINKIEDESIDLLITSPPYNIGKEYETQKTVDEYTSWLESLFRVLYKKMKNGKSVMIQVGSYIDKDGNSIPIPYIIYHSLIKIGFKFRQQIMWNFNGGMQAKRKMTGQVEYIMWFYKGGLPKLNIDSIRVKEWKSVDKRNNPKGKNPTDLWFFNRVAYGSKEKTEHPCQFPEEMINRIILGWSNEGDTILDCFMGSGTTAVSCVNNNRNYIGIERDKKYCEIAKQRLNNNEVKRNPLKLKEKENE